MSNRKRSEQPKPFKPSMTDMASTYVDQYEYQPDGQLVHFKFGRGNRTSVAFTASVNLMLDLANKMQGMVISAAKLQQQAKPEEPKND